MIDTHEFAKAEFVTVAIQEDKSLAVRFALAAIGMAAMLAPAPAAAQNVPVGVFCIHQRIEVERKTWSEMSRNRNPTDACVIGPTFNWHDDARNWVRRNMRADVGGSCSCR